MQIEKRVQARKKKQKIQEVLLLSLYATTALGMATVAPNSLRLLKYVEAYLGKGKTLDRRLSQARSRLCQKGLLVYGESQKGSTVRLTEKGTKLAKLLEEKEALFISSQNKWDGKWRVIIFDVWERRRYVRDQLRNMLKRAGFVKIQDSVWVYPYACEELFVFLRADLRLGKGMVYMVAEEIENDEKLRRHFNLPA